MTEDVPQPITTEDVRAFAAKLEAFGQQLTPPQRTIVGQLLRRALEDGATESADNYTVLRQELTVPPSFS